MWALLVVMTLLAVLVLAVLGSIWLFRRLTQPEHGRGSLPSADTACELLRRRYAAGEIDDEEYERRLTALTSH